MGRVIVAAVVVGAALAGLAHCGGTTGHDDSPAAAPVGGADASVLADATTRDSPMLDAGSDRSVYTNTFDVSIEYADRALPEVGPPPEGGANADASLGVPDCPPFLYVDGKGNVVPLLSAGGQTTAVDAVPADYSDTNDAGEVLAREGGVCATYPWLGNLAVDDCYTMNSYSNADFDPMPPCNWAKDAGVAAQGSAAGTPRYDLCIALYKCFMRTGCFLNPGTFEVNDVQCFCGSSADPNLHADCAMQPGPCFNEELAAYEAPGDVAAAVQYVFQAGFGQSGQFPATLAANVNSMFEGLNPCELACEVKDAGRDCGP